MLHVKPFFLEIEQDSKCDIKAKVVSFDQSGREWQKEGNGSINLTPVSNLIRGQTELVTEGQG